MAINTRLCGEGAIDLRGKAAIAGIGQTAFGWQLGRSEFHLALEAIRAAVADAGLRTQDIDGIVRYALDTNSEADLAVALGIPELRFCAASTPGGGDSGCRTVELAAMAVATGQANYVVAFRARNRGKRSSAGQDRFQGGRPWEKTGMYLATAREQFHIPFGLVAPSQEEAMLARRYMAQYGITDDHFAMVAVAQRAHASRNPAAIMRTPITIADHHASRWIAEPMRLLDCCLETDGACAAVVTTAERARALRQPPACILGAAQASAPLTVPMVNYYKQDLFDTESKRAAALLYQRAGVGPKDIDAAMLYDSFSPLVLIALEDFGFCGRGEAGGFVEGRRIQWPHGDLPVNTSGGSLSEAYIHGFNLITEGVRQIRGTSTCQAPNARHVLVTSANFALTSALILGKDPA